MFIIFAVIVINISAETYWVGQTPEYQFQTIQAAINVCNNADSIRVMPGTYRENLDFNSKNIFLTSLYPITEDTTMINTTKIIGLPCNPAINIVESAYFEVNGFTITNNENNTSNYHLALNGGIFIFNSFGKIKNNKIYNCISSIAGGGISVNAEDGKPSTVFLENNNIFKCFSYTNGGGLYISRNSEVTFSQRKKNSIYLNHAPFGRDISFSSPNSNHYIYLDKFTKDLNSVDQFFIQEIYVFDEDPVIITLDINQGMLPTINHDLYVAPWGDDTNDGLSPDSPLQTIEWACSIIASDSLSPKTIHLGEGTYSRSQNNQIFPFCLPSWTNLIGSGMESTILDNENNTILMTCINEKSTNEISDFSLINGGYHQGTFSPLHALSRNIILRNLTFKNNNLFFSGPVLCKQKYAFLSNIIVKDCHSTEYAYGLYTSRIDNLYLDNYIINNMTTESQSDSYTGFFAVRPNNMNINNLSIANCNGFNNHLMQIKREFVESFQNVDPNIFNNVLIYNNNCKPTFLDSVNVCMGDYYGQMIFNNWTVANNQGAEYVLYLSDQGAKINNSIFYNPLTPYELMVGYYTLPDVPTDLNNSLLYGGMNRIKNYITPYDLSVSNMLTNSPFFEGQINSSLSQKNNEYYKLSALSPCINAGTPDTTGLFLPSKDIAGNQRIWDGIIDMGCFEYRTPSSSDDDITPITDCITLNHYPNPLYLSKIPAANIKIQYPSTKENKVNIEIFNIKGQKINSIKCSKSDVEFKKSTGLTDKSNNNQIRSYSAIWSLRDQKNNLVPSGIYIYRAIVDGKCVKNNKMLILK